MKRKNNTQLFLELEGSVNLVEQDSKGKVIKRQPIDGDAVLKCLLNLIEKSIDDYCSK